MAGSLNLFDAVRLTASSEYASRMGERIQYLQIHHATMLNIDALIDMMMPGGRDVSANGAMSSAGIIYEVAPLWQRAYTSASKFDRQCLTVECCNTSLGPNWGISPATRTRLARLAVAMLRAGLLGGLTRQFIIGHNEVPGTYPTACPGPDMQLDAIVAEAKKIYSGAVAPEEEDMSTGAFYRIAEGQPGAGGIYWQERPNTVLVNIVIETWAGYAANGNRFVNLTRAQLDRLVSLYGTANKPESVTIGEVKLPTLPPLEIDYKKMAAAIFDEQALRLTPKE